MQTNDLFYYFFIIIYFKLRVGFHPVAVALQNDTQIKHNTQIKYITNRIQLTIHLNYL
jgi:hypothetical protein